MIPRSRVDRLSCHRFPANAFGLLAAVCLQSSELFPPQTSASLAFDTDRNFTPPAVQDRSQDPSERSLHSRSPSHRLVFPGSVPVRGARPHYWLDLSPISGLISPFAVTAEPRFKKPFTRSRLIPERLPSESHPMSAGCKLVELRGLEFLAVQVPVAAKRLESKSVLSIVIEIPGHIIERTN
jgi:hypothetical protein